jgi:hypothetical protein
MVDGHRQCAAGAARPCVGDDAAQAQAKAQADGAAIPGGKCSVSPV